MRVREWLKTLELPEIDRLEMDHLLAQWALCDEQIEQLDAKIAERAADSRNVSILRRCNGLGPYAALGLASRIGLVVKAHVPRFLSGTATQAIEAAGGFSTYREFESAYS